MSDGSNYMKFLNRKSDNSALARDREIGTIIIRVIMNYMAARQHVSKA